MKKLLVILGALGAPLAALGILAITLAYANHTSHHAAPAKLEGTVVWPAGMRPAPGFALRDQSGRLVAASGLRGQVWAVTFLDSDCRKACPVEAHELAVVQKTLGTRYPFQTVVITALPQYDTPARVRAFAREAGMTGEWHWLLGSWSQLVPVWRRYGIEVLPGAQHTAALYLVDKRGSIRVADAIPLSPSQLEASIRVLDSGTTGRA